MREYPIPSDLSIFTYIKGHLLRWPFLLVNSCGVEEAIGSERIVGENELEKRSLNLTARGGPACGSTLSRRA